MAYGTNAEVLVYAPNYANLNNAPSTDEIDAWLDNLSAVVDSLLKNRGYTTPVTDASDQKAIKHYVVLKAAAQLVEAAQIGADYADKARRWSEEWQQFLDDIRNGDFVLQGQTTDTGKSGSLYLAKPQRYPTRQQFEQDN